MAKFELSRCQSYGLLALLWPLKAGFLTQIQVRYPGCCPRARPKTSYLGQSKAGSGFSALEKMRPICGQWPAGGGSVGHWLGWLVVGWGGVSGVSCPAFTLINQPTLNQPLTVTNQSVRAANTDTDTDTDTERTPRQKKKKCRMPGPLLSSLRETVRQKTNGAAGRFQKVKLAQMKENRQATLCCFCFYLLVDETQSEVWSTSMV
uniref:Uncharacterized protein n=1 Tax=Eutreptiella gymnastica TaxID=73025 RepID=A0A7S1IUH8_9EUGL|mmetsp:Transcript_43490/g.78134  ORF Transcript_43490/g.78134 Transcript_43490/m.78134 type:complete len:205 (+) Transcript_43490:178-792(+)